MALPRYVSESYTAADGIVAVRPTSHHPSLLVGGKPSAKVAAGRHEFAWEASKRIFVFIRRVDMICVDVVLK
jgi:hypothetical protein